MIASAQENKSSARRASPCWSLSIGLLSTSRILLSSCSRSADKKDYDKGHVPGAQFLEYESISTPHNHGVTLMLELPPVEQLVSVFEKLGVSNSSHRHFVFRTNWVDAHHACYWTLDYSSRDRTSILNGGLVAWQATHHPVSTKSSSPRRAHHAGAAQGNRCDADWGEQPFSTSRCHRHRRTHSRVLQRIAE